MVLKLHGVSGAVCTRRVAVILKEKKVEYELVAINTSQREHKSEAYRQKQPFGQIPYIDDDGFILFESRAIARYVEAKYPNQGTRLAPPQSDLKAYALFEQGASIELTSFDGYAAEIFSERVLKKLFGGQPDEEKVSSVLKSLDAKLDAYEVILGKQKYIGGNEVSMADLFHLPYGYTLEKVGIDTLTQRPNVSRWWKDISSRPAWQAVKDGA